MRSERKLLFPFPRFHRLYFFPATTQPGRRPVDVGSERHLIFSDHNLADRAGLNHAVDYDSLGWESASALLLETGSGGRTRLFPTQRMGGGLNKVVCKQDVHFFALLIPSSLCCRIPAPGWESGSRAYLGFAWRTCACVKITSSQPVAVEPSVGWSWPDLTCPRALFV